jgi:tetratricopeptide (TPR) repeat protein
LGLVLVGLIEGGLWLAGVSPLADKDRFVDFSGDTPLFVSSPSSEGGALFTLNPLKENYFNPQSFSMPKPANRFRIVSLGGSTTYGRPYLGDTAFSRWLTDLGNKFGAGQTWEAINAGGISYASYRAARLQKELLGYAPDLFVVYAGHNELLEARTFDALRNEAPWLSRLRQVLHLSRLYSVLVSFLEGISRGPDDSRTILPGEVSVELETVAGPDYYHRDDAMRRGVLAHYRESLQRMIDRAGEQGVPLVLCTLPANLGGVSPFKSEHRSGLTARELAVWQQAFEEGNQAMAEGDPQQAVGHYQEALRIDDRYALLSYRLGHALWQSGQPEKAYQSFVRAKQEDIIPLRALEEINTIIRELARINRIPLADVEAMFRRVAVDGIPGSDLFDDHVHPNIRGQQMIAWAVFDTLVRERLVPLQFGRWQRRVGEARQLLLRAEEAVSPRYRALGWWGVGRLYFWAGKYAEAYAPLEKAWTVLKEVPEIPFKLGTLEVFRGDGAAAIPLLQEALRLEPDSPDAIVMLANAHLLLGQADRALELLAQLPAEGEESIGFLSARGRALLMLDDDKAGLRDLERAYRIAPQVPRTLREYAEGLARSGQLEKAGTIYARYLQQVNDPDPRGALERWVTGKGWQAPRRWQAEERVR